MGNIDTKIVTRTECQAVRDQLMKELESKGTITDNALCLAKNESMHTTVRLIFKWGFALLAAYLGINSVQAEIGAWIAGWF